MQYRNLRNDVLDLGGRIALKTQGISISAVFFLSLWKTFQNMHEMVFSDYNRISLKTPGYLRGSEGVGVIITSHCQRSRAERRRARRASWLHPDLGIRPEAQTYSLHLFLPFSLHPSFHLPFFPPSFLTFLKFYFDFHLCDMCQ